MWHMSDVTVPIPADFRTATVLLKVRLSASISPTSVKTEQHEIVIDKQSIYS